MKSKKLKLGVYVIVGVSLLFLVGRIYSFVFSSSLAFLQDKNQTVISLKELDQAIADTSNYMFNQIQDSGRLIYRKKFKSEGYSTSKYNLLRHAGVIYSLNLFDNIYQKDSKNTDKKFFKKRKALIDYMKREYMKPMGKIQALVSKPKEEGSKIEKVKLGGLGLGLLAMSGYYSSLKKIPKEDRKVMEGLAEFILFLQNNDGSFCSAYNWTKKEKDYSSNSLYYPGEASLGLINFYSIDKNPRWIQSAKKALLYLASSRENKEDVPFDHWALIATRTLFETAPDKLNQQEKISLLKHAIKIVSLVFGRQIKTGSERGALTDNNHPCSLGTYLEAFVATYNLIKNSRIDSMLFGMNQKDLISFVDKLKDAAYGFASYLYQVQIKEKDGDLSMIGAIPSVGKWRGSKKAVLSQIDNNQHVLSGWIGLKFLE